MDTLESAPPLIGQALPKCPHCGDRPVKLNLMFTSFPQGQIASLVYCGNSLCNALLPVQIVGMQPSAEKPKIVSPFGRT